MNFWAKITGKKCGRAELAGDEAQDRELEQTLRNFRLSVHAWSEAAYSRPRTAAEVVRHRAWRLAVGWALGGVLVAGSVGGGVYEYRHRQELARIAAAERETRQQQLAAAERARESEAELMARIDSDVSQQVPSALEPLAQLMDGDDTQ
ncbi:MAG: hypothetical protein KGL37_14030 [Acidobacteriota bacterium]|nr:hypothetical protein [Acidobacteriota bacterium]